MGRILCACVEFFVGAAMAADQARSFRSMVVENVEEGNKIAAEANARSVTDGFGVLNFIDFKWDAVSSEGLSGHFLVTPKLCQVILFPYISLGFL